ncbi:SDR family oxidoreductase [Kineococcus sp. NUM-3379]
MTFAYGGHTVLLTGASSGIGRSFAHALAGRGADLALVARRADRLETLAGDLRARYGTTAHVVPFDLSAPSVATDLRDELVRRGVHATALINNAGFGTFGAFADDDPDHLARLIAVNVTAPVQLTSAFLPQFLAAGKGFVINVASMAAYTPTPRMATYGAAKAFVLNFTEALWAEVRGSGVTVFVTSPGATDTEFNTVVGTDDATAGARKRTPEDVVATTLAHLDRRDPGPSVIDGRANRLTATFVRALGRRSTASLMGRMTDPGRRAPRPRGAT